MSTAPPIQYTGPHISPEVPWETRVHLQALYQKLGNHTQAFSIQQDAINKLKAGSTTTVVEGGGGGTGGGGNTPGSGVGVPVNNQTGQAAYATATGDDGALIILSDSAAIAVSLTAQSPPWSCFIANNGALGAGTVTLTPATGTISYAGNPGAASMPILPTYAALVAFDGTNWWAWTGPIVPESKAAVASEWLNSYNAATGVFTAAQPAISDVSGLATALALLAPLASPTFSGTVTQPAPSVLTAATTASSATAGSATALPALPAGYLEVSINGTVFKIPYYSV